MTIDSWCNRFIGFFKEMRTHYKSNNLMHTFGSDYEYTYAHHYYDNLDKIKKHINDNPEKYDNV